MSENTNVVSGPKARVRVIKNNEEKNVNVLTDPSNQFFGLYQGDAKSIQLYRQGEKALDGRTISDVSDKGVILSDGQKIAFVDYRNVVNLKKHS